MIAENFKRVLDNYLQAYEETYKEHPLAEFIRHDLSKPFKKIVDDEKYKASAAAGIGRWPIVPSLSILNKEITTSPERGYYIVYLFKEDMSGVYLSLNFGAHDFNKKYGKKNLIHAASNFRDVLKEEFEEINNYAPLDLGHRPGKEQYSGSKNYENGDIFNIYYSKEDLNSDEKIINDFKLFLKMYDYLYEKQGTTIFIDDGSSIHNDDSEARPTPSPEKSNIKFKDYLIKENYFFDSKTIENYLLSLKVKPFVILTGNSGTGKTKLSQLFADYLLKKQHPKYINHAIVPVGANWTENRNIVGYFNVLTKSYQHTQSLDLLLDAKEDKKHPYFLILDEMNLSHVERYFSDFLSAIESKKDIPLHKDYDKIEDEVKVPEELKIPENVFIIGTVNVDETTYMFSPKVLDRSNVLEFKTFEDISIKDYITKNKEKIEGFTGDLTYLENPLTDLDLKDNILSEIYKGFSSVTFNLNENNLLDYIINELTQIHEYLAGSGFEFGFRTVNEVLAFMLVAWKYEGEKEVWDNWRRYFDTQILQKILPKLHGSKMVLGETLDDLLTYCLGIKTIDEITDLSKVNLTELNAPYPDSAKKLIQMKKVLEKLSYVSFIN